MKHESSIQINFNQNSKVKETNLIYLQVGFAFGGNLVRVIAKIMKIMTGHKIKTSVQSCKIMIGKNINYIAEPKKKTDMKYTIL